MTDHRTNPIRTHRAGFTILEMMVALGLFAVVLVGAARALQQETAVFNAGNERLGVVQNYRFALNALEQDLPLAGAGVLAQQPSLVYAGPSTVAFNADYASRNTGDISAVFIDPDAPAGAVMAMTQPQRAPIPGTGFSYPDTTYMAGGVNSPAETITYFFEPDDLTARTDDFRLMRQVNGVAPEIVSRNVLADQAGQPFFEYTELVSSDTAPDLMLPIASGALPLSHSAPLHQSAADTGQSGRIDAIRAVRVNLAVTNGRSGQAEHIEPVSRLIWLQNMRERTVDVCGDEPIGVATPTALASLNPVSGDPEVEIRWMRSPDEASGEGDVVRYLLWRRLVGGPGGWGDPYLSVPAGNATYTYVDTSLQPGASYQYSVSAQDCTPTLSPQSLPATVTVPIP